MKKKQVMKYTNVERLNSKFHFFASSAGSWKTGDNLEEVLAYMKRDGLPFNLYYVPGNKDSDYEINMYVPQVEGVKFLGFWGCEEN